MGVTLTIARRNRAPKEHLLFGEHLTEARFDSLIRETFLGQAHIAGTGPEGTTCRQCVWWRLFGKKHLPNGQVEEFLKEPSYFPPKHQDTPNELKKQRCTRPILNKANRLIPHHAKSCRLFEENRNAPIARLQGAGHG